jgi:hypothetical protein
MKNSLTKLLFLSLAFAAVLIFAMQTTHAQTAKNKTCFSYEPAKTTLEGQLTRRAVVNASEQKETIWVIKLNAAQCVAADAENEMNPAIESVSEVQLVLTSEQMRRLRPLLNEKITVAGTLFAAHTQHHFTEVLMIVGEMAKK